MDTTPDDGPDDSLVERVRAEQREQWRAGTPVPVEEYLRRYPVLAADRNAVLELIYNEFVAREAIGEAPTGTEFTERFPAYAHSIGVLIELHPHFRGLDDSAAPGPALPTLPDDTPHPAKSLVPVVPGYELLGRLGRGGMGVVYRAWDRRFGREVAVKLVREEYRGDPATARRFVREALVTGLLQHPGVPPAYEVGETPAGDPFLAMKVIEGRTLAEELQDAARVGEAGRASSPDLPRLLGVFEQVCQTVGYAHNHGVIHRDLKPANVMIGAFGEVQVMDWGLAKAGVGGQETGIGEDADRFAAGWVHGEACETGVTLGTRPGQAKGTPAFMPPEQARGEWDRVDERADVFALGGILCATLTGNPPFPGPGPAAALARAAGAALDEAYSRLDVCGADAELVALCKRCLAPDPADRPENGKAVADAVAAYRAAVEERAKRAEAARAAAAARAEEEANTRREAEARAAAERKRRRTQLALAASLALLVSGGLAFAWWQDKQADARAWEVWGQLARTAEAVAGLLDQGAEALRAREKAKAGVALAAAEKRAAEGGAEALADRMTRLRADLAVLEDLDDVDTFRWTLIGDRYPNRQEVVDRYWAALRRFGADPAAAAPAEVAARVRASTVKDRLLTPLDLLLREKSAGVRAVLQAVDPDPFRDKVRDAMLSGRGDVLVGLVAGPEAAKQPPGFTAVLLDIAPIPVERRREALKAAVEQRPRELALLMALGATYPVNRREGAEHRVRWFQAAVVAAPTSAVARTNLGVALRDSRDIAGAIAAYRRAVELDPGYAVAHYNLGVALDDTGDWEGAIREYREALRINPSYAAAYNNLGVALRDRGDLAGAIAAFQKAIEITPGSALYFNNLGDTLCESKQYPGAVAALQEAIRLDPRSAPYHTNLGKALYKSKQYCGALAVLWEAIDLDKTFPLARFEMGTVLGILGDLNGAAAAFRETIRLDREFAMAYCMLGQVLKLQGHFVDAVAVYRKGREIGCRQPGWPYVVRSKMWVEECEREIVARELIAPAPRAVRP